MIKNSGKQFDLKDLEIISCLDELALWSAPFGLKLLDAVHYRKNIKALDIGCGLGFPLIEMAMRLGNSCRIYGIDPWKEAFVRMNEKIKTMGLGNIEIIEGVAESLPFEENSFDLIFSNNGINNVEDYEKVISECYRTCKPGGQFVFTVNLEKTMIEFYDVFKQVLITNNLESLTDSIDKHILKKRKPLKEIKDIMGKYKFRIIDIEQDEFFYRFSDAATFLNHFFIKVAFLPEWQKLVPEKHVTKIFAEIEKHMDNSADREKGIVLTVPYVMCNCTPVK